MGNTSWQDWCKQKRKTQLFSLASVLLCLWRRQNRHTGRKGAFEEHQALPHWCQMACTLLSQHSSHVGFCIWVLYDCFLVKAQLCEYNTVLGNDCPRREALAGVYHPHHMTSSCASSYWQQMPAMSEAPTEEGARDPRTGDQPLQRTVMVAGSSWDLVKEVLISLLWLRPWPQASPSMEWDSSPYSW